MSPTGYLIGGLLAGSVSFVGCTAVGTPTTELPMYSSVGAMTCSEDAAILAGWREPSNQRVDLETAAIAFRVSADGVLHESELGAGMLTSISSPDNKTVYAVRRHWFRDRPEEGVLFRSDDYGVTWQPVPNAPAGIVGVAFGSRGAGFVWSRTQVFRTSDQGRTWSGVASPGRLPEGEPVPKVDASGGLWIAAGHGLGFEKRHNAIARVAPDLTLKLAVTGSDFTVLAMDVGDDGALWLLTRVDPDRGPLNVLRLAPGLESGGPTRVAELPDEFPVALRVFGRNIVVVVAKPFAFPTYRYQMVSRDAGATWRKEIPRMTAIHEICFVSAQSSWIFGPAGKVYAPRP